MIVGVGVDVVDLQRFAETVRRTPGVVRRLFTPAERDRPPASLAARFAAKEALAKALGAPRGLRWHDAEVLRRPDGRPWLRVAGSVAEAGRRLGVAHWHVSLSHDGGVAVALVVAES